MSKRVPERSAKEIRCQMALDQLAMLRATGAIRNPALRTLWHIGNSQLANGKYADRAHAQLGQIITPIFMARQFMPPPPPRIPVVPAAEAILVGTEVQDPRRKVFIALNSLVRHGLLLGQNGTGKTFLMLAIVDQVMQRNLNHKGQS